MIDRKVESSRKVFHFRHHRRLVGSILLDQTKLMKIPLRQRLVQIIVGLMRRGREVQQFITSY